MTGLKNKSLRLTERFQELFRDPKYLTEHVKTGDMWYHFMHIYSYSLISSTLREYMESLMWRGQAVKIKDGVWKLQLMSKLRFKTKQELINEFGHVNEVPGGWSSDMHILFGKEYNGKFNIWATAHGISFYVSEEMLTTKELSPMEYKAGDEVFFESEDVLDSSHKTWMRGRFVAKHKYTIKSINDKGSYRHFEQQLSFVEDRNGLILDSKYFKPWSESTSTVSAKPTGVAIYNGMAYQAIIRGSVVEGKIFVKGEKTYLCQNSISGANEVDFGYKYSWHTSDLARLINGDDSHDVTNFSLKGTPPVITQPEFESDEEESDEDDWDEDELLSEAMDGYSEGDQVYCALSGDIITVGDPDCFFVDSSGDVDNDGDGYLYCRSKNKWATCVETTPEVSSSYHFSRGDAVWCANLDGLSAQKAFELIDTKIILDRIECNRLYSPSFEGGYELYRFKPWFEHPSQQGTTSKSPDMTKRFQIGDTIKFNSNALTSDGKDVRNYKCDTPKYSGNGSTTLKENKGTIVGIYQEYYEVKIEDKYGKTPIIAFKEEQLDFYMHSTSGRMEASPALTTSSSGKSEKRLKIDSELPAFKAPEIEPILTLKSKPRRLS